MTIISASRKPQSEAPDGALASAILATWKHDSSIRTEFGSLTTYAAYVRGTGKRNEVLATAARLVAQQSIAKPTSIVGQRAAAVVTKVPSASAIPAPSSVPPGINDRNAGKWLSDRYKAHHANAMVRGMSYGAACGEAKKLCDIDRGQLRQQRQA